MSEHQVKSPQAHAASAAVSKEVMPAQEFLKEDSGKEKLSGLSLQCKLSIGATDDPLEQEAETIADKVMRMPAVPLSQKTSSASLLQMEKVPEGRMRQRGAGGEVIRRKCSQCEEEKLQRKSLVSYIQRKESSAGTVASEHVIEKINASRGGGRNLDGNTQSFMQNRFGADFSQVKIHTGTEAIQMNRELNARAFTVGNDIYFNEGQYNPNSGAGKHLLAHELTHTVQQKGGVNTKIQKSCTPPELIAMNIAMHGFCDLPRACNQTDTCQTVIAKIAAGNGCISLRTLIQQNCFRPGDPGYEAHMEEIARAYATLRNCYTEESEKCNNSTPVPVPVPVPAPAPSPATQRSGWERIRGFARQAIETGATAASAIRAFLIANPELIDLVIGVGVAGLVATFAEDIVTLGAGIIDDLITVPFFASMISVAMELRQAIAAGTLITTMTTR